MRFIFLALFFALANLLSSQITLEHGYGFPNVDRIWLENDGEKYVRTDKANQQIVFYNADHTPWKTIQIPLPGLAGNYALLAWRFSQYELNDDDLIEYNLKYGSTVGSDELWLNELGDTIFRHSGRIERVNGQKKLIGARGDSTVIYAMPGFVEEHVYPFHLYTLKIAQLSSGDYYCFYDNFTLSVFNSNHTLRKVIPNIGGESIDISENRFNDAPDIEVLSSWSPNGGNNDITHVWAVDEIGEIIFGDLNYSNLGSTAITTEMGEFGLVGGSKMIAYLPGFLGNFLEDSTRIYSLPSFAKEHTFPFYAQFFKDENGGNLIANGSVKTNALEVQVFDPTDYQPLFTVPKPGDESWYIQTIQGKTFDNHEDYEIGYAFWKNYRYGYRISEASSGTFIFEEPYCDNCKLSEKPGAPTKLICGYSKLDANDTLAEFTRVYSLPTNSLSVKDEIRHQNLLPISAMPNPSSDDVLLCFEYAVNEPVTVEIVDIYGRKKTLYFGSDQPVRLRKEDMSVRGSYFVRVLNGKRSAALKIMRL